MKTTLQKTLIFSICLISALVSFSQGANTQAGATASPITLPLNATGTTVGATNNFDQSGYNFDDGPDWYYYYCATTTNTIWVTVTFTPSATTPVNPSVTILSSMTSPANGVVAETQVYGDNSGTIGIPYTPLVGECIYIIIDNDNVAGPNGFPFGISVTNTTPTVPTPTLQSACSNIGFDNGTTSSWSGSWGHSIQTGVAPAPTPKYTPIFFTTNMGSHNVTTGGTDLLAPIQQVCPLIAGNTNSLRLGDGPNAAFGGASITQKFSVTSSNALFTYYYATVIQDGGASGSTAHTDQEQPFFRIEALDCSGNPITCGNYLVTGGPGIPGFTQIGTSGTYWKDWTPVMLDLTPYIGSCVTIRFTIGDCSIGAHYAYAYIDATCGPVQIVSPPDVCQYQTSTLTAPTGGASYAWVNTASPSTVIGTSNTLNVTPTTTGTFNYQCTITSVTGCTTTVTASLNVLPSPQITVTDPPAVCSPNTVDITSSSVVTVSSGTGTISYYSDAACTVPISSPGAITTSGTYYIKILGSNGCYDIQPVTVVVNQSPTVNVTTANQTICSGQSVNLNATISPAGVNNPVTFTNSTDFAIPDASVTPASSTISVSGINPQTAGVLPIVSVNLNIAHTFDGDLTIWLVCPDGSTIDLSSDNGGSGQNYTNTSFVPSGGTAITSGTAPFTGSYAPEDAFSLLNSCSVNGTWTLQVYDLASGDVGTLLDWSITFNNYVPTTFAWSPTINMTNSTTLTPTVSPTTTTTYTFTGTNPLGGCTASDQVTISVNPLPTATIASNASVCLNGTAPTITFTGSGATAPYTFSYNINVGTTQTVSSGAGTTATVTAPTSTAGTFTYNLVSVTSNSCSQTQTGSAVVTVNPLPTITGTLTVCQGSTTQLTGSATAATTNPWVSSNTGVATVSNTGLVTGVSAGTSTITYTNSNGCTTTATVTVNLLPTVTAPSPQTVCANAATTAVTFTGNSTSTTYNWTNNTTSIGLAASGSGNIASFTATNSTTSAVTGTITVTPTLNGCTGTAQNFTITVNPLPTITGTLTVCQGSTTQLTGSGTAATTNPWVSSNTGVATVSNTGLVTGVSAGTSTITYTNSNGCTTTATVTVNLLPTVTAPSPQTVCANAATTAVTFTGNSTSTTYNWTNNTTSIGLAASGSGNIASFTATNSTSSPVTGTITVTPTLNGCTGTAQSFTITVNPLPTITGTLTVCQGSTTQLTGSGTAATTNPWTSSTTSVATVSNTGLVTGVSAGTSNVTYTNSSGCQITATVTINALPTITGTLHVCVGSTTQLTGSATAAASNPWTSSNTGVATVSNSGLVSGVSAGTTTITYTNSNGCSQTATVTVNPLPTATITGNSTICAGSSTSFTISGTPNATVTYSNGTSNLTVTLNSAGNATVNSGVLNTTTTYTLVSAQSAAPASCSNTLTGSVTVTVNPIPVMNPVTSVVVCPGDAVVIPSFTSTPTGATFNWTNTNSSIGLASTGTDNIASFTAVNSGTNPVSGTVTVIPTLNGCVGSSQSFTIGVANNPLANAGTDVNVCLNAVTGNQIGVSPVNGMTYSWSPTTGLSGATVANPTVSTATAGTTTYTLTVTNAAGCSSTDDVTVIVNPLPVINFGSDIVEGCAPLSVTFTNNSANSVNCVWTFEGGGSATGCGQVTHVFNTPGTFDVTLTMTDNNGCSNTLTQTDMITVYPVVIASFGVDHITTSVIDPEFHFTNNSQNATDYTWYFGDGSTSSVTNPTHSYGDDPAVYHVELVATNNSGCADTATIVVEVVDELIYYVPNCFTPDGDEFNNVFFPVFSSGFDPQSYTLLIFDRWGEVIFESHNVDVGWDGTYHNELCKEGVYTWKIVIKERNKDKRRDIVGHVTLLK